MRGKRARKGGRTLGKLKLAEPDYLDILSTPVHVLSMVCYTHDYLPLSFLGSCFRIDLHAGLALVCGFPFPASEA